MPWSGSVMELGQPPAGRTDGDVSDAGVAIGRVAWRGIGYGYISDNYCHLYLNKLF